jgi:hypothetical protein
MASGIRENNKKIALSLGLEYHTCNNKEGKYPGWHTKNFNPIWAPDVVYCRYHKDLNFDCSLDRQYLFFEYLSKNDIKFEISSNSGVYTFSYKDKIFTDEYIAGAIYQAILNEFKIC